MQSELLALQTLAKDLLACVPLEAYNPAALLEKEALLNKYFLGDS